MAEPMATQAKMFAFAEFGLGCVAVFAASVFAALVAGFWGHFVARAFLVGWGWVS